MSAVIGIHPTVPAAKSGPVEVQSGGVGLARILSVTGVVRVILAVAPGLEEPDGDGFTAEERERMRLMTSWNFGNDAVADETARIGNNASDLRGVRYPDGRPVLTFVSGAGSAEEATKTESLKDLLKNVKRHEIIPLAAGHYLHWTQAKRMAEEIRKFLGGQQTAR
ncbi:hypothetical protein [Arthrobacter sp. CG_A4]|uniref:hypothetical protein n=1 Tax=Arthrobacter sp. CG_A4 TaxID=3071706 RepID=UPI002E00BB07|nr:hypothetical protein [Arthrobacter sp. CG_A4]